MREIRMALEFKAKLCAWRWSSKRSFVHGLGVQSEALCMALEFKAKLCAWPWSSKRSFVQHGLGVLRYGRTKLRFELQRAVQSFALNSNVPYKASL
jgi:hypothetical protein